MKTVAFCTLGCKVNQYETQAVSEKFAENGFDVVDFSEHADVYIINTCQVTALANRKSRQMIRRAKRLNPQAVVCVMGCATQLQVADRSKEIRDILDEADIVVPKELKYAVYQLVMGMGAEPQSDPFFEMDVCRTTDRKADSKQPGGRTRGLLKIEDGCDRFCSYCIIPYTRGGVKSRPIEQCLEEARRFSQNGFNEIVLTGINISAYEYGLLELLKELDCLGMRIRIGSIEPYAFTRDFIEGLGRIENLCPHLHISLQSGCDATLVRMNRHYTTSWYMDMVNALRSVDKFDILSLTTDIITGFPGETCEEFQETIQFVKKVGFSKIHAFPFSPRPPSKAATMPMQLPGHIKAQRCAQIIQLSEQMERHFRQSLAGRTLRVLVERKTPQGFLGYTENYLSVCLEKGEVNQIVETTLT